MFIYLTDNNGRLIEFMKEGSSRFDIWNSILKRDLTDFQKLPLLKLLRVETDDLLEKVELKLRILIDENNQAPKDYPNWQGRFDEKDIFIKMNILSKNYVLCNTGRESNIIFLGNVFCFLQKTLDNGLFELIGLNHAEINKILKKNGST